MVYILNKKNIINQSQIKQLFNKMLPVIFYNSDAEEQQLNATGNSWVE